MSDQPSGQPRKPKGPTPDAGVGPAANSEGRTPNGIPHGKEEMEPLAKPSSDRQNTETAAG